MKKLYLLMALLILTLSSCKSVVSSDKIQIAVTIAPEAAFVDVIGKDRVEVTTVVPAASEPESYEPTVTQMLKINNSEIYFGIGLPIEDDRIYNNLPNEVNVVDLSEAVSNSYNDLLLDGGRDPHIWLSPKRVIIIINTIKEELIKIDPQNETFYENNATDFLSILNDTTTNIENIISSSNISAFICYHPAFQYFASDFNLTMYALEKEGEEASAITIAEYVQIANEKNIKTIFYQAQQDSSQALSFAEEIDGSAIMLNPLSYDYIDNLISMANAFAQEGE